MSQYTPQGLRMLPPVVKNLLIINLIVFLATMVLERYGFNNITSMLALNSVATGRFRIWQLFTYMFMHANWSHIIFNMFALWMFGYVLENYWGSRRFLVYYLVCGIGAGLCNLLVPDWASPWALREPSTASCWPSECFSPKSASTSISSCPSKPNGSLLAMLLSSCSKVSLEQSLSWTADISSSRR